MQKESGAVGSQDSRPWAFRRLLLCTCIIALLAALPKLAAIRFAYCIPPSASAEGKKICELPGKAVVRRGQLAFPRNFH